MEASLDIAVQQLKQEYPQLSDMECSAIYSPLGFTWDKFRLRTLLLVENTAFAFINNTSNNLSYSCYSGIARVDPSKPFYRSLTSDYFFYNLEHKTHCKDGKIVDSNYTGLSSPEELQYTHFIADALTQFLNDQDIEIRVVPDDQVNFHGEFYNSGRFLLNPSWNLQDCAIYVDHNFVDLAKSLSTHQDLSIHLLFSKDNL